MIQKSRAIGNYFPIETAPLTGKAIRLLLKDGFGTYSFEPAVWDKKAKQWANARSGKIITPEVIGWSQMKETHYGTKA